MRWPLPEKRTFWTPERPAALERRLAEELGAWIQQAGYVYSLGPLGADESQPVTLQPNEELLRKDALYISGRVRPAPAGARVELTILPGPWVSLGLLGGLGALVGLTGFVWTHPGFGLAVLLPIGPLALCAGLYLYERSRAAEVLSRLFPREDWR